MPAHKNQHFVPRVHLKPFSDHSEGRSISLYASQLQRYIHKASVSGQCSGDYFYCRDGALESKLEELETRYGLIVESILDSDGSKSGISAGWLLMFWCAQWSRTESAARRYKEMVTGATDLISRPDLATPPPEDRWVVKAMLAMEDAFDNTCDLRLVILRNKTDLPFVTSDNPAVFCNRFHAVDRRVKLPSHGLANSGTTLFLPLTPHLTAMFYDPDVHAIPEKNGRLDVKSRRDIAAINELQVLSSFSNIYFRKDLPYDWIEQTFKDLASEREKPLWKHYFARPVDSGTDVLERFRVVDGKPSGQLKGGILLSESIHRKPRSWPSFLHWRARGYAYDTDTAAGIVRRSVLEKHPLISARILRINM